MILLSLFCSFYYLVSIEIYGKIYEKSSTMIVFIRVFGNWLLILGNFIPISLLLTIELIKFF